MRLMLHIHLLLLTLLFSTTALSNPTSAGCGAAPPKDLQALVASNIVVDGQSRDLIVVIPRDYQPQQAHALVFAFHGRTDTNAKVRNYFQLEKATREPTIFVYPAGTRDQKEHNHWWRRHDKADALRDFDLFDQSLALLEAHYCIDPGKVYLIGHSLGATFVNSLGCARADQVRAIVSVAGGIRRASCAAPLAAMLLHNPKDQLVKIADGERARDWLLKNNGLESERATAVEPEQLNCMRYGPEQASNPLIWCAHHQDFNHSKHFYPHNWPRLTAEAAFEFFASLGAVIPETNDQELPAAPIRTTQP